MTALESFARIHRVMAILTSHPEGLSLDAVAAELGVPSATLRREILEYFATDIPAEMLMGLNRADTIEFLAADGAEADPHQAPVIRAVCERPEAELGVEYLRADDLVALYEAASGLAELEPDNVALAHAVEVLADTFLARSATTSPDRGESTASLLRDAMDRRQPVRITYSRAWRPGVSQRDIHPYALHHTARGWEVDAGPLIDGRTRTYIVARISACELLSGEFDRPVDAEQLIERDRAPVSVDLSLPQGSHWVADRFAESTRVLTADSDDLLIRVELLPPIAERVGLILLIAGPEAFVMEPASVVDAGADLARQLLVHHGIEA